MTEINELTAYFATWERPNHRSKVHVLRGGKPICGSKVKHSFYVCAVGIQSEYIECERCKKLVNQPARGQ